MFNKSSAPPPDPTATPSRRLTDTEAPATVIGPGTRIEGDLTCGEPVELAGILEGHSHVTGTCRVLRGARIVGDVKATSIVIEGELSATTLLAQKVEIGAHARVRANVRARVVAIAEGALFDGEVHMEDHAGPPVAFKEKRQSEQLEKSEIRAASEDGAAH